MALPLRPSELNGRRNFGFQEFFFFYNGRPFKTLIFFAASLKQNYFSQGTFSVNEKIRPFFFFFQYYLSFLIYIFYANCLSPFYLRLRPTLLYYSIRYFYQEVVHLTEGSVHAIGGTGVYIFVFIVILTRKKLYSKKFKMCKGKMEIELIFSGSETLCRIYILDLVT